MNEKKFLDRINELEDELEEAHSQLEDAYVVIDLQQETIKEKTEAIRALKGQLRIKMADHNYTVGIK